MFQLSAEKEAFSRDPHQTLHWYGTAFFVFLLPLWQNALPLISLFLGLNGLLLALRDPHRIRSLFHEKKGDRLPLLLIGFFLLHILGSSYSEDLSVAAFDLQKKLGFLFFPLLFWSMPRFSSKAFSRILLSFVGGCAIAVVAGMVHAYQEFLSAGNAKAFHLLYGEHFAYGMHRGYLAMYLLFGIMVLLNCWSGPLRKIWPFFLLSLILLTGVLLTGSRSALLIFPLLAILYTFRSAKGPIVKRLGVLGLVLLIFGSAFLLFSRNWNRFEEMYDQVTEGYEEIDPEHPGGVEARLMVWSVGKELFLNDCLIGVGTGEEDAALRKAYDERGWDFLKKKRLNAHSQYLQTGIAIGVFGVLLLVGILLKGLQKGWYGHPLLLYLSTILMVSALFESVLERQAGIFLMAFFLSLLAFSPNKKKQDQLA